MIVSGNGQVVLAFTSDPKFAIVWDLKKKTRLPNLGYKDMKLEIQAKKGVAVSHNGQYAVAIDKQFTRNFVIWEVATGEDFLSVSAVHLFCFNQIGKNYMPWRHSCRQDLAEY
jgi:hypothetical protein